jgi:hypothetical protein
VLEGTGEGDRTLNDATGEGVGLGCCEGMGGFVGTEGTCKVCIRSGEPDRSGEGLCLGCEDMDGLVEGTCKVGFPAIEKAFIELATCPVAESGMSNIDFPVVLLAPGLVCWFVLFICTRVLTFCVVAVILFSGVFEFS